MEVLSLHRLREERVKQEVFRRSCDLARSQEVRVDMTAAPGS